MGLLISGLLIWSVVHLIPSVAPPVKQKWKSLLGETGYKLSFTVLLLISLALIIFGWRSSTPSYLYQLPEFVRHLAMLLVLIAFILLGAANYPSRIGNFIRHPMLTGVMVWAIAHLLVNGDSRSVLLFGGMGIWAVLEIVFINRRDGEWVKKPAPGWGQEFKGLIISFVIFVVVVMIHPYMTGVAIR
jgi:uncharacterized membrane protein